MPPKQTKSLEEANQMLRDTIGSRAATGRQTMRPLMTEPIEILRYALSELEQTMCTEDEASSFIYLRQILNEGIIFLQQRRPRSSSRQRQLLQL